MKKYINSITAFLFLSTSGFFIMSCSEKKTLHIYTWTYYAPTDVVEAFEKEYDCDVVITEYDSNETMFLKLLYGGAGSFDIVFPSQDYVEILMNKDMLQPVNQELFTNRDKINPKILEKASYDSQMKYAVPYYFGASGISVNKTKVKGTYERSWNIFADPQFKGRASMMNDYREVIGDALKCKGLSVCTKNRDELKDACSHIQKYWKPNIVKFDAEGFGKDFANGNLWLCQGYAEVIYGEVPEEEWAEKIDFFIPESGGPSYLDSMCILKDSEQRDLATQFINYIHEPKNYAKFLDFFRFPCFVNPEAEQYMETTPMYPAKVLENCELKYYIGDNKKDYSDQWKKIIN